MYKTKSQNDLYKKGGDTSKGMVKGSFDKASIWHKKRNASCK